MQALSKSLRSLSAYFFGRVWATSRLAEFPSQRSVLSLMPRRR
jgi:hypothetical protein